MQYKKSFIEKTHVTSSEDDEDECNMDAITVDQVVKLFKGEYLDKDEELEDELKQLKREKERKNECWEFLRHCMKNLDDDVLTNVLSSTLIFFLF